MPKLTAPMLSMGASGQLGKTMVFAKWKGVPYARQHVVPANPRSTKQVANRGIWAMLGTAWLYAPTAVTDSFNAFATGKSLTGRNKFFSSNQKLFATDPVASDTSGFIMSPGANGGLPATNLVVTPGSGELVLTADIPGVPTGWTLDKVHGAAIESQDPTSAFSGAWYYGYDDSDPYSVTVSGLTASTLYDVGLWLEWSRADGSKAYSISLAGSGTPT